MTPSDAIEANAWAFPLFHRWSRAEGYDGPELLRTLSDIPAAYFNRVGRANLRADEADAAIEDVIGSARAKNVSVLWWVGPSSRPLDLGTRLVAHGFAHTADCPGMAKDLLAAEPPPRRDLRIERVRDREMLRVWNALPGFGEERLDFYAEHLNSSFFHYVGYIDGEPVGTSTLFIGAGIAGIYGMFTPEAMRGRGVGAALAGAAMSEARALRHRQVVLLSRPSAAGFYSRLGFVEHCRFGIYVLER